MNGTTRNEKGAHMINFIQAVHAPSKPTNCPVDLGFRISIACRMMNRCASFPQANARVGARDMRTRARTAARIFKAIQLY